MMCYVKTRSLQMTSSGPVRQDGAFITHSDDESHRQKYSNDFKCSIGQMASQHTSNIDMLNPPGITASSDFIDHWMIISIVTSYGQMMQLQFRLSISDKVLIVSSQWPVAMLTAHQSWTKGKAKAMQLLSTSKRIHSNTAVPQNKQFKQAACHLHAGFYRRPLFELPTLSSD